MNRALDGSHSSLEFKFMTKMQKEFNAKREYLFKIGFDVQAEIINDANEIKEKMMETKDDDTISK